MKTRILPLALVAILLSAAPSEARARRHGRRPAEIASGSSNDDSGGPLARTRGLSQAESAAVGTVLAEIASSRASAADAVAANLPARKFSPDYYRVYSRRMQAAATAKRVVAAAPAAKPAAAAAATPAPIKPPAPAVRTVAVAPPTAKVRVAATPPPAPAKPTTARRVAVAAPVVKPPPTPTPKPAAAQSPTVKPRRVLMLPPGTTSRIIVVPASPTAPAPKKRKADETIYAAPPQATGQKPIRAAFREPDRR